MITSLSAYYVKMYIEANDLKLTEAQVAQRHNVNYPKVKYEFKKIKNELIDNNTTIDNLLEKVMFYENYSQQKIIDKNAARKSFELQKKHEMLTSSKKTAISPSKKLEKLYAELDAVNILSDRATEIIREINCINVSYKNELNYDSVVTKYQNSIRI